MNRSKIFWLKLLKNTLVITCVSVSIALLLTATYLDSVFENGELTDILKGMGGGTNEAHANFYSLCFFKEVVIYSWSMVIGDEFYPVYEMSNFRGKPILVDVFLDIQNDIRLLATILIVISCLVIWVENYFISAKKFVRQDSSIKTKSILYLSGNLVLWIGIISFRGKYVIGSSSNFSLISAYVGHGQETTLILLLTVVEFIFIGIFPISLFLLKKRETFYPLLIGIFIGYLSIIFIPVLGGMVCRSNINQGFSPLR